MSEIEIFVGGVVGVCGEAEQSLILRRVGHDGDLDGVVGKEALLERVDRAGWWGRREWGKGQSGHATEQMIRAEQRQREAL